MSLKNNDLEIYKLIQKERKRQQETLMLIPSENYTSKEVREALGSVLTNKYSEGEPKKRYYEGNEIIDQIELLAVERARKLFGLDDEWHINVKALSASIANFVVYNSLLQPGDTIMSMNLTHGGHISHGWYVYRDKKTKKITSPFDSRTGEIDIKILKKCIKEPISVTSKHFNSYQYPVEPGTKVFDYNKIEKIAKKVKPKIMISGGTSYSRDINYKKLSEIAHKVGALYMADVAHEAGLIAGKAVKSPFLYADIVTTSTQKTLRGPRGSIIFMKEKYAKNLDKTICPGMQGGPFNNNIAGIAVCLKEAGTKSFSNYAKQVVKNAQAMAQEFVKNKFDVVTGGTDKHLVLLDLTNKKLGKRGTYDIVKNLAKAGLVMNRNTVPFEKGSPFYPSGIRFGTPGLTTRGFKTKDCQKVANLMINIIKNQSEETINKTKEEVQKLACKFPIKDRV